MDCGERVGLREEARHAVRHDFRRPKTSDDWTDYIAAIVNPWGVKRTPNAMKLGRRPTYNITRPHANSHPILRTFSGHLSNNISDVPRARASVVGLRTDNRENEETGTDASFVNMMMQCT